jgi:hypothetical protein
MSRHFVRRGRKIFLAIENDLRPLNRTIPRPPKPGDVDIAMIVSSNTAGLLSYLSALGFILMKPAEIVNGAPDAVCISPSRLRRV